MNVASVGFTKPSDGVYKLALSGSEPNLNEVAARGQVRQALTSQLEGTGVTDAQINSFVDAVQIDIANREASFTRTGRMLDESLTAVADNLDQ